MNSAIATTPLGLLKCRALILTSKVQPNIVRRQGWIVSGILVTKWCQAFQKLSLKLKCQYGWKLLLHIYQVAFIVKEIQQFTNLPVDVCRVLLIDHFVLHFRTAFAPLYDFYVRGTFYSTYLGTIHILRDIPINLKLTYEKCTTFRCCCSIIKYRNI